MTTAVYHIESLVTDLAFLLLCQLYIALCGPWVTDNDWLCESPKSSPPIVLRVWLEYVAISITRYQTGAALYLLTNQQCR